MFIIFNIVIIGLVLLIAYWWANQGMFSALLHLLCVIAAGAIALSVWEPVVTTWLLRGNGFDDYAWGITLVGVFVLTLLILRVIMDKTVRGNIDLPHWANLSFGFPLGAAAGVITMGIFLIGAGFVQSETDIMGFAGRIRSDRSAELTDRETLWVPVHSWTNEFYAWLSVTSLSTDQPMRQFYPRLDLVAGSEIRDSALDGRGKLSLKPDEAQVTRFIFDPTTKRYGVEINFSNGARDFGEQLTISSAQIRLIGEAYGTDEAKTVHPDSWTQYDGWHKFDHKSHYITSEPGQTSAKVMVEFNGRELEEQPPLFIQIRGTRYRLPRPAESVNAATFESMHGGIAIASTEKVELDTTAASIQSAIEQSNSIRPIQASTNMMPTGIKEIEKYLSGGDGEFVRSGAERPSRALMIKGILEPAGTRIIMLNVSRNSSANIFDSGIQDRAGGNAGKLVLVDTNGRPYPPIGFIHERPDNKTRIALDFSNFFPTPGKLPALPTSGDHTLKLLFSVTEGATIAGFKYGNVTLGLCNLTVKAVRPVGPQNEPPPTETAGGKAGDKTDEKK